MYPINMECGVIGGLITYPGQLLDIEFDFTLFINTYKILCLVTWCDLTPNKLGCFGGLAI